MALGAKLSDWRSGNPRLNPGLWIGGFIAVLIIYIVVMGLVGGVVGGNGSPDINNGTAEMAHAT
jgi:hypothetical protein